MSIRYRFFLIVGLFSTIVLAATFFVQNFYLNKSLVEAREEVNSLYVGIGENQRRNLEDFIRARLAKQMSQINALLEAVSQYAPLAEWFAPSEHNISKGTWNNAANLLESDDWINFIQNSTEHQLLSQIVPQVNHFSNVVEIPIEEGLSWIFIQDSKQSLPPYIGIELSIKSSDRIQGQPTSFLATGGIPNGYVFYEKEALQSYDIDSDEEQDEFNQNVLRIPFLQNYELDEARFKTLLQKAVELVKTEQIKPPEMPLQEATVSPSMKNRSPLLNLTHEYLEDRIEYSNELYLIWQLTALYEVGIFGKKGESLHLPIGMSFFGGNKAKGQAFLLENVIDFRSPLFDDRYYFQQHPPEDSSSIASGVAIIEGTHLNQLYIGNTAALFALDSPDHQKKVSWLTIGYSLNNLLEELVLSLHKYGFIMHGGKIWMGLNPEGERSDSYEDITVALAAMGSQSAGKVDWHGQEFYALHMQPDPKIDLHFFLLTPIKEAFALIDRFESQVSEITETRTLHIRIIEVSGIILLLIVLLDLSKKITKPIIALSDSLKQVKTGNWEKIKIPKISFKRKNELKQLCDSFAEMVEGLKEKEKVTGILNKVVSAEIAKEILKGEVHLGGEEREVTILFADIRNFTFLTQNMAPHEVIELLNHCMTKLSEVIDVNQGVIDKYIGDGIMALYGAPIASEESVFHAICSGLQMLEVLKPWNQERKEKGLFPIEIGIGIHTGPACVGNMGALNRLNYTVIGSTVNLASRLCYAASPNEILITEDTYQNLYVSQRVAVEDKGLMSFKGFDQSKRVFKVTGIKV